ncbi:TetR/AcrR family transcriptional regulator [Sinorhizobium sp. BG8]|uniref:TetR/AcrR family transcriptional regulator n=1 Tax=Sinorhizobium sp. BG8 TaxID=2613773 RepID=UPI00193C878A|nr:TetR/AcrR family transcriptional regulator [Sinorhizobium sp. BG8]QRM55242.1 TetR/AcrR family transcriptional regulator [Sinorhizobium sp. BG8]
MRPTKEQARENRQRIIETAAQLFRENGIHAVGIDAVMKGAGLTHGGFYGHFKSKDDLVAEAVSHAIRQGESADPAIPSLEAFAAAYLAPSHRDAVGDGCAVAALGPEIARLPAGQRGEITDYVRSRIALIGKLQEEAGQKPDRARAIRDLSSLVGALVMSRLVEDPDLSDEILEDTLRMVSSGTGENSGIR